MPSSPLNNFLAPPQPHHHVSRLITLTVILAIIVLVVWLYSILILPKEIAIISPHGSVSKTTPDLRTLEKQINTASPEKPVKVQEVTVLKKEINQPAKGRTAKVRSYEELMAEINSTTSPK